MATCYVIDSKKDTATPIDEIVEGSVLLNHSCQRFKAIDPCASLYCFERAFDEMVRIYGNRVNEACKIAFPRYMESN